MPEPKRLAQPTYCTRYVVSAVRVAPSTALPGMQIIAAFPVTRAPLLQLESLDNQERLAGAIAIASLFEGGTAEEDQATVRMHS